MHAEPVAAKRVTPDLEAVVEASLHVHVFGTRDLPVLVDLKDLAGIAATAHFLDH